MSDFARCKKQVIITIIINIIIGESSPLYTA